MFLEASERSGDTISFHIGSPLFIALDNHSGTACEAFNGQPFYVDNEGRQIGWGFVEVSDSVLFPTGAGSCRRYLMLSSEQSNLLAEGFFPMSVILYLDEKRAVWSDTVILHPLHASSADSRSYSSFLKEQIVTNSSFLRDQSAVKDLFSNNLPKSYASQILKAVIEYRNGDIGTSLSTIERADNEYSVSERDAQSELVRDRLVTLIQSRGES